MWPCSQQLPLDLSGAASIRSAFRPHSKPVLIPSTWRHTTGSINIHSLLHGLLHPAFIRSYRKPDVNFMLVLLQPVCAMLPYLLDAQLLLPHLPHTKQSMLNCFFGFNEYVTHHTATWWPWKPDCDSHQSRYRPFTLLRFYATFITTLPSSCVLDGLPILLSLVHMTCPS